MSDVDSRIQRISAHKGVKGILVINSQNQFLKSTMPAGRDTDRQGIKLKEIANQARDLVRSLDPSVRYQARLTVKERSDIPSNHLQQEA